MPIDASRKIQPEEVETFLGNGWFMGLGPERCLVAWGKPKKAKAPTTGQLQFYVPDFYLSEKSPWVTFENVVVTDRASLIEVLDVLARQPQLDLVLQDPAFVDFESKFQKIQEAIARGQIRKAVPVVLAKADCSMTKSMRARFIRNLLQSALRPTPYGYLTPTRGVLGASPEKLFSYDARTGELRTMALASTRATELEKTKSLAEDPKEMFEHELVVQGLKTKLSSIGDWHVSPTYVWDIGRLSHLRTDFSIELAPDTKPLDLFVQMSELLHPTAALGISPVTADWRFLKTFDGADDRGFFGAPFGVMSPDGCSQVLVAIRNLQWDENGIRIGTGCGIVEQSRVQEEWQELEIKRQSIYEFLGL